MTFRVKVVVLPRGDPVIVTVTPDASGAVPVAVSVNVEVAAGEAGVTGFGVKADAVTPDGSPLMLSVTG